MQRLFATMIFSYAFLWRTVIGFLQCFAPRYTYTSNVHANWYPVEGIVKKVEHHNGNFHKAWLPKASTENERSTIVIETPQGQEVLVRQVAGAVARRIVTYAQRDEECYIDEHLGFIKFGSRVDVYLPLDSEILVKLGQATVGNQTIVARLSGK
jgi:phosphatidylserine decarboxylase